MWDLPGPGLEPVSPALAGRFLTTVPPRKSLKSSLATCLLWPWTSSSASLGIKQLAACLAHRKCSQTPRLSVSYPLKSPKPQIWRCPGLLAVSPTQFSPGSKSGQFYLLNAAESCSSSAPLPQVSSSLSFIAPL